MGVNGILLLDKDEGWTSQDCVSKLRGILGERRIGHAGSHFSPVSFSEINLCRTDVMDRRPAVIEQLGSCQMRVDISYGAEQQVAELTGVEMLV